ncbi:hypothetical protein V1477_004957 [Vespula maculifrons]|uniref:Uncharacterized protein n=1 Tax=Vespula maculifrons TaxID=7453 RepID=A0ABD2CND7_VESMC
MLFTEAGRCSPSSVGRLASGSQASKQESKQASKQASKRASRQASRQAGRQQAAGRQAGRLADRQAGRQANRQAGEASSFESRVGESVADDSSGRQVREDKIDKGKEVYPQGWSGKDIVDKRCEEKGREGRRIRVEVREHGTRVAGRCSRMKESSRPLPPSPPHPLARAPRGGKRHRRREVLSKSRDRCVENDEEDEDDGEAVPILVETFSILRSEGNKNERKTV